MKHCIVVVYFFFLCAGIHAQVKQREEDDEEERKGFKKELLFSGGSVSLYFFNKATVLGVSPHLGYSITRWLDAAVSMNVNYISQRNYIFDNDRIRQLIYAPGAFVRLYPVHFLYAEAHFERNFINQKYIYPPTLYGPDEKINYKVNTLLAGIGYASDRQFDEDEFYYVSLSMDVLRKRGSPYTSARNNPYPIVRAGVNIKLFRPPHRRRH